MALEAHENMLHNEYLKSVYPNCCICLTAQVCVALRLSTRMCPAT